MSGRRAAISARAAPILSQTSCDRADVPMLRRRGPSWASEPLPQGRGDRLGGVGAPRRAARADRDRRRRARSRPAEKTLSGCSQRPLRRQRGPNGQGGRGHHLRRPARPRFWRSSANRVAASRRSPKCCSGSRRRAKGSSCSATRRSRIGRSNIGDVNTISSIQMIFQNPFDTLNPSYSVGSQIMRTLERFRDRQEQAERRETMLTLLDLVKLPRAFARRAPRQFSGGQKQRIGVARAFAGRPASSSLTSRCRRWTSRCRRRSASS